MTNPIDQDLAMQWTSSTSPLLRLSQTSRISTKPSPSLVPTGKQQIWISYLSLLSFSLKESARKLPWVFLSSPPVHRPKERQNPTQKSSPYLIFLAAPDRKSSSKKEASFNSLKLSTSHTSGPATRKGNSFHVSPQIYIYIYMLFWEALTDFVFVHDKLCIKLHIVNLDARDNSYET